MAMIRRLQKFKQLTTADKQLLAQACFLLWQVRLSLWVVSYKDTRNWLKKRVSINIPISDDPMYVQKIIRFVNTASRFVPHSSCLIRALVAETLLRKFGFDSSLHIGIKVGGGDFEAHAWLEMNGEKLIGGQIASGFKQIYCE